MAGLGETVAGLANLRKAMAAGAGGDDAGMGEVASFGANPGALRMLAYVPRDLPQGAPLVVVLHGCTQRAGAHARSAGWLTLADRLGFAVVAPEQSPANNPNRCFNWFEPGDTARGSGEAASIRAMVEHMVRSYGLDAGRVFVTGLSAGGAMTAVLLAAYPDTFAGGAVIAGVPVGVAGNVQEAFNAMRTASSLDGRALAALVARSAPSPRRTPRLTVWHGSADTTVASGNGRALARQWAAVHGLAEQPDEVEAQRGWTRSRWHGPDGQVLVEDNLIAGLGHGTPLASGGAEGVGEPAPFMLEAGVSSALEIARFWDLAPASTTEDWQAAEPSAQSPAPASVGDGVLAAVTPHVSADIRDAIAAALGKAGLLR